MHKSRDIFKRYINFLLLKIQYKYITKKSYNLVKINKMNSNFLIFLVFTIVFTIAETRGGHGHHNNDDFQHPHGPKHGNFSEDSHEDTIIIKQFITCVIMDMIITK